jgi:hypothetical protein
MAKLLEPLASCLTPEVAQQVVALRADPEVQARLDDLADKANEGRLSAEESQEYAAGIDALDLIAFIQARARSVLNQDAAA